MKQKRLRLLGTFLFSIGILSVSAQQTATTTGGEASGSGGSASYTVGQVVYTTSTGTNGSVAEGVQQPYEISVVSGIEQAKGINIEYLAYPNPINDFLTLKVENYDNENLSYQLFNINGNLIKSKIITGDQTEINMQNFVPATYFLKVVQGKEELKTIKIIKN